MKRSYLIANDQWHSFLKHTKNYKYKWLLSHTHHTQHHKKQIHYIASVLSGTKGMQPFSNAYHIWKGGAGRILPKKKIRKPFKVLKLNIAAVKLF